MKQSLFRGIRQKLLHEGKLGRYLSYAIGEVLLIIVGILFALKIDDWNEDRKAQREFDAYVVQLTDDVRQAIDSIASNNEFVAEMISSCETALSLLDRPELSVDERKDFEAGINRFGFYSEAHIHIGLLGDLLDGNKTIIGRDKELSLKALVMESRIEVHLNNLDHIYNRMDIKSGRINQFVGRGMGTENRGPIYKFASLKESDEFKYTAYSHISDLKRIVARSGNISSHLERFLVVLEEYE